ncbi:hypothetical protein D3C85_1626430 [compost metagenome]
MRPSILEGRLLFDASETGVVGGQALALRLALARLGLWDMARRESGDQAPLPDHKLPLVIGHVTGAPHERAHAERSHAAHPALGVASADVPGRLHLTFFRGNVTSTHVLILRSEAC